MKFSMVLMWNLVLIIWLSHCFWEKFPCWHGSPFFLSFQDCRWAAAFDKFIYNSNFLANCWLLPWKGWISFTRMMRGLPKVTQSTNDVFSPESSLGNLQVKWKCINIYEALSPALVRWRLKASKSNLVVVIVFSLQNFIVAPAEHTTSSVSFISFQWGNLSLLGIRKKRTRCDGLVNWSGGVLCPSPSNQWHRPRTPCWLN